MKILQLKWLALAGACVLTGCADDPPRPPRRPAVIIENRPPPPPPVYVENRPPPPPEYVENRPPPPEIIVERRPAPPFPYAVWVPGHWRWNGHRYVWSRGHYRAA